MLKVYLRMQWTANHKHKQPTICVVNDEKKRFKLIVPESYMNTSKQIDFRQNKYLGKSLKAIFIRQLINWNMMSELHLATTVDPFGRIYVSVKFSVCNIAADSNVTIWQVTLILHVCGCKR